jgi:adenosylmethionine-8-amino-7-oxononanoate aminotransferase
LLILGTDTDAGKTTLALFCLAAFADRFEYWKPVETGDSDTDKVRRLVPAACVHPPLARFEEAVAPLLAARHANAAVPTVAEMAAAIPSLISPERGLLIETFGSPFSPLTETELQIELVHALKMPCILVSSSAIGAIGRTLQTLKALAAEGIYPLAIILMGPRDTFALEKVGQHWQRGKVISLRPPDTWDREGIATAAREQLEQLRSIASEAEPRGPGAPGFPGGAWERGDLIQRDRSCIWHPYTSLRESDAPLPVVAAQDEFLHLADGRKILDGISSWWTILHGHRHPRLLAALREAMNELDHVHFAGVTHRHAVELAELLLSTAPWPGGRVFFSDNGSTAVEIALKMAYQFWCHRGEPKRTLFIGFEHGYHGDTFGAMAVGRDPVFFGCFEPLLFKAEIVPVDAGGLDATLTRHRGEVAAIIIEPLVQGAGGMRMHSPDRLREIFEVARRHEVLFIADEVMTGGGRTGALWGHQSARIAPDLICAAKTLTGGVMPLAATLAAPSIAEAWNTDDASKTFFHGHSFTAHPLACAVAAANWKMLTASANPAPARMEAFWKQSLARLTSHLRVRDVRIRGSIAAVELNVPGGYLASVGRQLRRTCLDHGVLLRPLGSVLYALPPFCTSEASLAQIAEAMIRAATTIQ